MILENKITLVTGASRGIGQAIAVKLGQQGAVVIGTATTENGANSISQYLEKTGIKGAGVTLNVIDTEQINHTVQT
ncbi:MAG: SDR family NAD(P)-dependent oxidoreductase, partial [Nitrosomonas sp.]|nr:SDR family NAD(P)-dependent oxidoreductase [Nitrosomonas sp.]